MNLITTKPLRINSTYFGAFRSQQLKTVSKNTKTTLMSFFWSQKCCLMRSLYSVISWLISSLKKPIIISIQKKIGTIEISDHRPINMLSSVEKLMEQLAFNQFNNFVNRNKLLDTYAKRRSTMLWLNGVLHKTNRK